MITRPQQELPQVLVELSSVHLVLRFVGPNTSLDPLRMHEPNRALYVCKKDTAPGRYRGTQTTSQLKSRLYRRSCFAFAFVQKDDQDQQFFFYCCGPTVRAELL